MRGDKTHNVETCPACGGAGRRLVVSGRKLRSLREEAGLSLREVATRMGLSAAYISDLELGRRTCSSKRLAGYLAALEN